MNLYRKGDFVTEARSIYCVPAAIMTMMNIMERGSPFGGGAAQTRLYRLGRRLSTDRFVGTGVEPEGWAGVLNKMGYGPYRVSISKTRNGAIRTAAKALRLTGRPVGLVTWRGVHSWVMSGFKATADPEYTDDFRVTDVYIEDVWYPRVSTIWGPSEPPNTRYPVSDLRIDFLRFASRYEHGRTGKTGNFVVILPVDR